MELQAGIHRSPFCSPNSDACVPGQSRLWGRLGGATDAKASRSSAERQRNSPHDSTTQPSVEGLPLHSNAGGLGTDGFAPREGRATARSSLDDLESTSGIVPPGRRSKEASWSAGRSFLEQQLCSLRCGGPLAVDLPRIHSSVFCALVQRPLYSLPNITPPCFPTPNIPPPHSPTPLHF